VCLHSVARYVHSLHLGLLYGGAIVRMTIQKLLELPDDIGLAIYTFKAMRRPVLRRELKRRINGLKLNQVTKELIVNEKQMCCTLTNAIISSVRKTWRSYTRKFAGFTLVVSVVSLLVYVIRRGKTPRTRPT